MTHEEVSVIDGLGGGKGRLMTQPPIVNPKTGNEYDLNDPEFPVVKDHAFKIRYWAMPKSTPFFLKYMKEHWAYFNKDRFHGAMKEPKFGLLKDVDALRMRLRGRFTYNGRVLELSPNLWNAPHEGWVNRILIHEMCHQYVYDVHGQTEWSEEKGHGPLWKQTMRMAGLPPSRFDLTSNEMFFDAKEVKKHKPIMDYRALHRALKTSRKSAAYASKFDTVVFAGLNGVLKVGVVACRLIGKESDMFMVSTLGADGKTTMWHTVHEDNMFMPIQEDLDGLNVAPLMNSADRLHSKMVLEKRALP